MSKETIAKPDCEGHRQRLRTRFLCGEGRDMADYELLELVLTMSIPRRDVKPLAKILVNRFGSFAGVINAPADELLEVPGVKEATLTMLKVIKTSAGRLAWQNLTASDGPVINNFDVLLDYCRTVMCGLDVEELRLIYLDAKLRAIGQDIMQRGTINAVAIHPREVIKAAMAHKASSIIMVHNHPSGDVTPSRADIEMTKNVAEACKAIDIKLHDHLIIGKYSYYSFSEHIMI